MDIFTLNIIIAEEQGPFLMTAQQFYVSRVHPPWPSSLSGSTSPSADLWEALRMGAAPSADL